MGHSSSKQGYPIVLVGAPGNYGESWVAIPTNNNQNFTYQPVTGNTKPIPLPKNIASVTGNYSQTDNSMLVSIYLTGQTNPIQVKLDQCNLTQGPGSEGISCQVAPQNQQQLQNLLNMGTTQSYLGESNNSNTLIWLLLFLFLLLLLFLFFRSRRSS